MTVRNDRHSARWAGVVTAAAVLLLCQHAAGQMFGPRELGGSVSRRPGPTNAPAPPRPTNSLVSEMELVGGSLSGNERFLRENRTIDQFVGTTNRGGGRFIGISPLRQALVRSAIPLVPRVEQPSLANRPQPEPPPTRPRAYEPRLSIDFEHSPPAAEALAGRLNVDVARWMNGRTVRGLEVEVAGRTAILTGEVAAPRDRVLVEQLVRQEPGIDRVENRLLVRPTE